MAVSAPGAFSFHSRYALCRVGVNPTWSRDDVAEVLDPAYALDHIIRNVDATPNALRRLLSW